jgi:uncharacterized integral membrane protein
MTEVALEPVPPLSKAIVALPFAVIAALAWSDWVLWPAILIGVMIAFGFRRQPRTLRYAAYSSIYAAVVVFAIPPWTGFWFLERLQMFFVALLLSHLIGLAFDGSRHGSFWAWCAPLILFLIQPSTLGMVAMIGFGLIGALEKRQQRLGDRWQSRDGLLILAATGFLLVLVTLPLPRPGSMLADQNRDRVVTASETKSVEEKNEAVQSSKATKTNPSTRTPPNVLEVFNKSFMIVNVALLTFMICMIVLVLRNRSRNESERSAWEDALPLIAAAILGLMVLLYGASAPGGGAGSGETNANQGSGLERAIQTGDARADDLLDQSQLSENPWPTVILALLTAASIAWVMLRNSGRNLRTEPIITESEMWLEPEAATNRVRESYRAFLALCTRAGLGRLETETPLEFAQRISETQPLAQQPTIALTTLYEPVRYGGLSDFAGAQAAERALGTLRNLLQPQKDVGHDDRYD